MPSSVYIHIPFCIRKCAYCDFLSDPFDESVAALYVEALVREISLRVSGEIGTIYFGGGTPSLLSPTQYEEVFRALRAQALIMPEAEITMEANPGAITIDKAHALAAIGVNRFSLGVQSFNDSELHTLGRIHSSEEAFAIAKEIGSRYSLSVDAIYGVPGQTLASWEATLRRAVETGASHISAYELSLEPGTPLKAQVEAGALAIPREPDVLEMFALANRLLRAEGFEYYEISNYARPGMRSRHNMNYWLRGDYIGLGAGAHSLRGAVRSHNTGFVFKYIDMLSKPLLPVEQSAALSAEEELREFVFLGLRTMDGIALDGPVEGLAKAAAPMIEDGLLEISGARLRFTLEGVVLSNSVTVRLMERLGL